MGTWDSGAGFCWPEEDQPEIKAGPAESRIPGEGKHKQDITGVNCMKAWK